MIPYYRIVNLRPARYELRNNNLIRIKFIKILRFASIGLLTSRLT